MSETNRAVASSEPYIGEELDSGEYQALETALLQTGRGRSFLNEYLRRNGGEANASMTLENEAMAPSAGGDTDRILQAVEKLHAAVMTRESTQDSNPVRMDILEMAKAIAKTRAEITAMRSDGEGDHLSVASGEMDAIVKSTEKATNDILQAAEKIQEVAWRLREAGVDDAACEEIDNNATDIYMACSFQDLTGQRTTKVVQVLQYLEARINSMIEIWGLAGDLEAADDPLAKPAGTEALNDDRPDAHLLNGPQVEDVALGQDNIDALLGDDPFDAINPDEKQMQADYAMVMSEQEPAIETEVAAPVPDEGSGELIDEEQLKALFS